MDLDIMDKRLINKRWLENHPVDGLVQIVKHVRIGNRLMADLEIMGEEIDGHFKTVAEFSNQLGTSLHEQSDIVDTHVTKIDTLEKQVKALTKIIVDQSKQIKKLQGTNRSSSKSSKSSKSNKY